MIIFIFATLIHLMCSEAFVSINDNYLQTKDIPFPTNMKEAQLRLNKTKKVILTYGENCCENAKKRLCDHAMKDSDFDECIMGNKSLIDSDFYHNYQAYLP